MSVKITLYNEHYDSVCVPKIDMKTIEEVIDNIVDEHKECRWMDAGELREYLEVVAREQKAIDEDAFHAIIEENVLKAVEKQKAIDIDKACEWLESHFRDIENPDFYSKRNHPTDLESMYHWSVKELVDDFRKSLEE